jgi:hypothetical protein
MITAGRLASRWLACGSPIVNVPQSQRAGPGAGAAAFSAWVADYRLVAAARRRLQAGTVTAQARAWRR